MPKETENKEKIVNTAIRLKKHTHKEVKIFLAKNENHLGNPLTFNALNQYLYDMFLDEKSFQEAIIKRIKATPNTEKK